MKNTGNLILTTPSDREIAMTRVFHAPRHLVFEAYTNPELVKQWLGVFGGWSLDVCEIDLRAGGKYRYVWNNTNGSSMAMGGEYRKVARPDLIVATEKFDDPWYEGEAIDTTTFVEKDGKTTLTTTTLYASKEIRDNVLKSPMEGGVAASYDKLEELLPAVVVQ